MGETNRLREKGVQFKQLQPGQQIPIDLKNAVPRECECGCKFFIPVLQVYTVSALVSPTGQELTAQQPVLVCMECKVVL
jgi:hypothetical protein